MYPDLPDDVLTTALARIWHAALDAALSPDFTRDEAGRERYRRNVLLEARHVVMGLRPDRSHPVVGGWVGVVVSCTLCGADSGASVHLSDAGVDLREVQVGAIVLLEGADGGGVAGLVKRMDTPTFGVVEVNGRDGAELVLFSALNVLEVVDETGDNRVSLWGACTDSGCVRPHEDDEFGVRRHELPQDHAGTARFRRDVALARWAGVPGWKPDDPIPPHGFVPGGTDDEHCAFMLNRFAAGRNEGIICDGTRDGEPAHQAGGHG